MSWQLNVVSCGAHSVIRIQIDIIQMPRIVYDWWVVPFFCFPFPNIQILCESTSQTICQFLRTEFAKSIISIYSHKILHFPRFNSHFRCSSRSESREQLFILPLDIPNEHHSLFIYSRVFNWAEVLSSSQLDLRMKQLSAHYLLIKHVIIRNSF